MPEALATGRKIGQQQHHHDHQQHHELAVRERLQEIHGRSRYLQVGQQPAENGGGGDHEQDHAGTARGMDDGVEELAPAQLPVQHGGDQQGIDHGDGRALPGGEDAGTAADAGDHAAAAAAGPVPGPRR
ncbi:hypothetical protein G6F58_013115 [Rhizopus delemar]|nr:hypothetical protein G6F58_013115 [Rhizopus delemar]